MDYEQAVRYPFSQEAKAILQHANTPLNDFAIELGLERIKKALAGKLGKSTASHDEERLEEIVSYAAARLILGYMRNRFITNKFAVAEAKRASSYLNQADKETIIRLEKQLNIYTTPLKGSFQVPLPTYISFAPMEPHYRLVNRRLQNGKVFINSSERLRLLEEAIHFHIRKVKAVYKAPETVKNAADKLKKLLPKVEIQPIDIKPGDYPPCVRQLLDDLKRHENLPHHARLYLAIYLLRVGMPAEQVVSLYSNLPDFSERTTRYQIEHAKKRGYAVPKCATIKSWGIVCESCNRKSPLQWRGKYERKRKKTSA